MRKALFLYNPAAGRGRIARNVDAIVEIFAREGWGLTAECIRFDRNPFDAHTDIELVVVAGGDGTVNFTVNRMKERNLDLLLGIIPAGTANDFAGIIGMRKDPLEAARQIATGQEQRLDCGRVNGIWFVNIFSFGIFTTTSQRTSDQSKHRIGKLAYLIEGIKELRTMHTVPLQVETESGSFEVPALLTLIFNGETAGGFRLADTSSVRDGRFDCLLLERRNLLVSAFAMLRFLLGGRPSCIRRLQARRLHIVSTVDEPTDVDGQPGARFPLDVECLPGALRIVCPDRQIPQ